MAASVRGRDGQHGARRPRRVLVLTRRSGPFAAGNVGRAGGGPRRAPCVLAQRDGQPSRPPAAVEGSGHYGSQFPLIGSRLQPDQGPDVSSETRWTHAQDRRACRCARAPRFLRLPCCPSRKICAGELLRCNRATRSPQAPPRPPRCRGSPLGRLGDPPKWGPPAGPPAASRLTGNGGIAEAVRSHNGFTEGRKPAVPTRAVRRRLRARLWRGDAPATQKRAEVWH